MDTESAQIIASSIFQTGRLIGIPIMIIALIYLIHSGYDFFIK
jgi:hypothetical protein